MNFHCINNIWSEDYILRSASNICCRKWTSRCLIRLPAKSVQDSTNESFKFFLLALQSTPLASNERNQTLRSTLTFPPTTHSLDISCHASFIHSFHKHLLSTYCMPRSVLRTRNVMVSKLLLELFGHIHSSPGDNVQHSSLKVQTF